MAALFAVQCKALDKIVVCDNGVLFVKVSQTFSFCLCSHGLDKACLQLMRKLLKQLALEHKIEVKRCSAYDVLSSIDSKTIVYADVLGVPPSQW